MSKSYRDCPICSAGQRHHATEEEWATPEDFAIVPLTSAAPPPPVALGSPLNAAVRSWMSSFPNLSYHAALLEVARRMPDLADNYASELRAD